MWKVFIIIGVFVKTFGVKILLANSMWCQTYDADYICGTWETGALYKHNIISSPD